MEKILSENFLESLEKGEAIFEFFRNNKKIFFTELFLEAKNKKIPLFLIKKLFLFEAKNIEEIICTISNSLEIYAHNFCQNRCLLYFFDCRPIKKLIKENFP